jgi:hypothetical protein
MLSFKNDWQRRRSLCFVVCFTCIHTYTNTLLYKSHQGLVVELQKRLATVEENAVLSETRAATAAAAATTATAALRSRLEDVSKDANAATAAATAASAAAADARSSTARAVDKIMKTRSDRCVWLASVLLVVCLLLMEPPQIHHIYQRFRMTEKLTLYVVSFRFVVCSIQ